MQPPDLPSVKPAEPDTPRLALSPREAARALAISERSLWRLRDRGAICVVNIGRRIIFPVSELERFLNEEMKKRHMPGGASAAGEESDE